MNTFKILSLLVAAYGLQAQAQPSYDGGSNYGGLYQYYQRQGPSQDQDDVQAYGNYRQPNQPYGNYGYGQVQPYGNSSPSDPYNPYYQYYQGRQGSPQSQDPASSGLNPYSSPYGSAYGSTDPYGFDAQDPTMPSRRGSYGQPNDQYGQYGTPNSPASPFPQGQGLDPRTQRPSRDGYGYQNPQDSQGSMSSDDGEQIRQYPHRGQIGSRKSQSDMDESGMNSFFKDQKKSCDSKLSDIQKKALVDIVAKSVGGDEGKISDAVKNQKITVLGTSVKQQGSAIDCKFQSQVTILFKSNNGLSCTVKATASIDSTGQATFGKEQNFACGNESKETNVRTGVEVYKTNFEKPAVAPSKGGRA